ncbi:neuromedin-S preproprotein isoform A [Alligator mississippiensis]|uniref:Neuromedin-S preproprotein isoform A n=1 Tax=Alligator mississippiensis TaxID=8496 RepID=A0A151NX95_ALLMI|nr:neuromedin-S preproprotein isoform A [Alligator mississippiensis]
MRLPQPGARHRHASDLPDSQQLALCFSQWTELNQPQISSSIMDLCNSIFNSMQIAEPNRVKHCIIIIIFTRKIARKYIKDFYFTTQELKIQHIHLKMGIVLVPWDDPFFFSGLEMEELLKMVECRPSRRFPWSMKLTGRLLSP